MSTGFVRRALRALVLTAFVIIAGCAEERDPISRVQADALAKSFFVGHEQLPCNAKVEVCEKVVKQGKALAGSPQKMGDGARGMRWIWFGFCVAHH